LENYVEMEGLLLNLLDPDYVAMPVKPLRRRQSKIKWKNRRIN
jgi:hypothetical protein